MSGDEPSAGDELFVFQFFNEIGIIDQLASAAFQRALGVEINRSEFSVLNHFVRLGDDRTPTELANAFQMSKPAMTAIIASLERKGYVVSSEDREDRRSKRIKITDAGRMARVRGVAATGPLARDLLERFGADRLKQAFPALVALRTHLDAARD